MGSMRDRFDEISGEDLEQYCVEKQEENLHLDFKTVSGANLKSGDDRRNLAKALSGFANSEGGMIIWGIDARKNDEGIDCAQSVLPIENVRMLLSRLNSLESDLVSPPVGGVAHRIVYEKEDGSGCAATLVPPSDEGPHMAKGGVDKYYRRSGDSFKRMEHYEIADMFGRRPKPELRIRYEVPRAGRNAGRFSLRLVVSIENTGRGAARAPYLAVSVKAPFSVSGYGVDGNGRDGLPRLVTRSPEFVRFGGTGDHYIHAGTYREVLVIAGDWVPGRSQDVCFSYELAADGAALKSGEVVVPAAEIDSGVRGDSAF